MTDDLSSTLSWFADFTNFYSIVSVLVCFLMMVVFILRLNGENFMSSSATHYPVVREQPMVSLQNPASVLLDSKKASSLKGGLHLLISMKKPCKMKVMWAVGVEAFQRELQLLTDKITQRFIDGNVFDGDFKKEIDCGLLSTYGVSEMLFKCPPELSAETLGEPPRMCYPVTVITVLNEPAFLQSTAIILQFTVIHLKDSICGLDSHIVYQFVKTNTNKLLSLQPIFMTTTEPVSSSDSRSQSSPDQEKPTSDPSSSAVRSVGRGLSGSGTTRAFETRTSGGSIKPGVSDVPSARKRELCSCETRITEEEKCEESNCDNSERNGEQSFRISKVTSGNENDLKGGSSGNCDEGQQKLVAENENVESSGDAGTENTVETLSHSENMETCCVVCQCSSIFYTLLPCRHACVCSTCMQHLDKCPICRGYIEAYFRLHSRYARSEQETVDSEETEVSPVQNRWQAFNQRLNELLGFV